MRLCPRQPADISLIRRRSALELTVGAAQEYLLPSDGEGLDAVNPPDGRPSISARWRRLGRTPRTPKTTDDPQGDRRRNGRIDSGMRLEALGRQVSPADAGDGGGGG
jgi:hypothetical protein